MAIVRTRKPGQKSAQPVAQPQTSTRPSRPSIARNPVKVEDVIGLSSAKYVTLAFKGMKVY